MRYDKLPPMHKACALEGSLLKDSIKHVYILGSFAIATNNYIVAVCRIDRCFPDETLKALNGKLIRGNKWKLISSATIKNATVKRKKLIVERLNGNEISVDLVRDVFPNYKGMFLNAMSSDRPVPMSSNSFDPALMQLLGSVISYGCDMPNLNVSFANDRLAIIVHNPHTDNFGAIMPCHIEEHAPTALEAVNDILTL